MNEARRKPKTANRTKRQRQDSQDRRSAGSRKYRNKSSDRKSSGRRKPQPGRKKRRNIDNCGRLVWTRYRDGRDTSRPEESLGSCRKIFRQGDRWRKSLASHAEFNFHPKNFGRLYAAFPVSTKRQKMSALKAEGGTGGNR